MKAFGFAAILISVGVMAACTVTSGDGDTSGDGGSGASGSTTTSSATTGEGGSGGTGGGEGGAGGGGEVCADAETADDCSDCCDETYAEGVEALGIHGFEQCGCAADSACASVCDTTDATSDVCNDDGTINLDANNADCVACLNDLAEDDACIEAAAAACEDDAACSPYLECLGTCQ
ncbi:hypothetical protein [Sorangium sp. So ce381]|uniref:hypothetical protein n=1 Tax=Sorangium sp. So ce381 TaxID=3133307 RepID=UPI003F5CA75D